MDIRPQDSDLPRSFTEPTINDRIYINQSENLVNHSDVCNRQTPFEVGTFIMLIKSGASDTNLAVECPNDISRNFNNVKFSAFDGTNSCLGKLEMLSDKLKMNYTYYSCDNYLKFSVDGFWRCLHNINSGSTTYLATLNMDRSLVRGQTYRMVCYTLQRQDRILKATIYPGSCRPDQTATYVVSPGVHAEMYDISDHELGSVKTYEGVAVGISVAVIVLVCIIAVTVFIRRRYIRKTTVDNALDQQGIAPSEYTIDDKILYSQVSKSIKHNASEDTQSPYFLSEKELYDHTNERRHVVTNTDVYSHAVDTVYDSSEQHTRQDRREEIYDHVFGQKIED
ncbi:uncharacterized protein LOC134726235 [Mytilus trossulus]|uniref:uncharacterized protein LOC134726235 n=1 Tax=Mytilus trossulus TaxID=6551 RepID=UPI003003E087